MDKQRMARFHSDFFRDQYRRSIYMLMLFSCLSLVLVCFIGWFLIFKKSPPVYYGASIDGRIVSLVPEKSGG